MKFAFYTKKDGRIQEYSPVFNSEKEAHKWYEDNGEWLEKTFSRKLHLFRMKRIRDKSKSLIREEI
jgi:hypothetical protein